MYAVQAVMRLTQEQRMQMVTARALLLSKMRTILIERHSLIAAAKVSACPHKQFCERLLY